MSYIYIYIYIYIYDISRLRVKYPSHKYKGRVLKICEVFWQVFDVKCCRVALVMLS